MTSLRRIPIRIEGNWQPVAYVGHLEWHGSARADEPITALAPIRTAGLIHWARAGHQGTSELNVRLSVRPGAGTSRADATIGFSIQPPGTKTAAVPHG
jgi:hypothetical protein